MKRRSCLDCKYIASKKEKFGLGIITNVPYCSLGVTNNPNDKNRVNGKCIKFESKEEVNKDE